MSHSGVQKLTGHAFDTTEGQLKLRVPCGEVVPMANYGWKEVHEEDMESYFPPTCGFTGFHSEQIDIVLSIFFNYKEV